MIHNTLVLILLKRIHFLADCFIMIVIKTTKIIDYNCVSEEVFFKHTVSWKEN